MDSIVINGLKTSISIRVLENNTNDFTLFFVVFIKSILFSQINKVHKVFINN